MTVLVEGLLVGMTAIDVTTVPGAMPAPLTGPRPMFWPVIVLVGNVNVVAPELKVEFTTGLMGVYCRTTLPNEPVVGVLSVIVVPATAVTVVPGAMPRPAMTPPTEMFVIVAVEVTVVASLPTPNVVVSVSGQAPPNVTLLDCSSALRPPVAMVSVLPVLPGTEEPMVGLRSTPRVSRRA